MFLGRGRGSDALWPAAVPDGPYNRLQAQRVASLKSAAGASSTTSTLRGSPTLPSRGHTVISAPKTLLVETAESPGVRLQLSAGPNRNVLPHLCRTVKASACFHLGRTSPSSLWSSSPGIPERMPFESISIRFRLFLLKEEVGKVGGQRGPGPKQLSL